MDVKTSVRQQFGAAAASYATSNVHAGGPDLEAMLTASGLGPERTQGRLLDVGTGAGHTAFAFARRIAHVEALDLTPEMLDQVARGARERGLANIHCQLGDAEALPYPDASFDFVTSRLCAHHFQDVVLFAREAARVLKPGGRLLLVDSMAPEDASADTFFNTFELLRDPSHVRNYSRSQWRRILDEAGFDCEVLGRFPLAQDFDGWVARIGTPPTAVAHLRFLFENAHADLRREFEIVAEPGAVASVSIPCGLLRARRR